MANLINLSGGRLVCHHAPDLKAALTWLHVTLCVQESRSSSTFQPQHLHNSRALQVVGKTNCLLLVLGNDEA
eukprot:6186227-Pleurochrysis_carterae.AAC.1